MRLHILVILGLLRWSSGFPTDGIADPSKACEVAAVAQDVAVAKTIENAACDKAPAKAAECETVVLVPVVAKDENCKDPKKGEKSSDIQKLAGLLFGSEEHHKYPKLPKSMSGSWSGSGEHGWKWV